MTELSPVNEARLEAFKALVAPQPISTGTGATYYFTVRHADRSTAFVADLLGELAAAQERASIWCNNAGIENLRAEAAEQEARRAIQSEMAAERERVAAVQEAARLKADDADWKGVYDEHMEAHHAD